VSVVIGLANCAEFYDARIEREERVIFADTDVFAGHDLGAALANDDLANAYFLSVTAFDAEVLRIRVSQIFRCSACFCMGHAGC